MLNLKKIQTVFVLAFLLNWIWENLHSVLYYLPSGQPITQALLLRSTFFDAVIITILGFFFFEVSYLRARKWYLLIFGIVIATFLEKYSLWTGRWAYGDIMPIIPILETGLTPTIQLGLLAYFTISLVDKMPASGAQLSTGL